MTWPELSTAIKPNSPVWGFLCASHFSIVLTIMGQWHGCINSSHCFWRGWGRILNVCVSDVDYAPKTRFLNSKCLKFEIPDSLFDQEGGVPLITLKISQWQLDGIKLEISLSRLQLSACWLRALYQSVAVSRSLQISIAHWFIFIQWNTSTQICTIYVIKVFELWTLIEYLCVTRVRFC